MAGNLVSSINMTDIHLLCSICSSEPSTMGCVCDRNIRFIGALCMESHLNDRSSNHNIVDLDLALRMQADPSLVNTYLSESIKIDLALNSIESCSHTVKHLKNELIFDKERLFAEARKIYNQPVKALEKHEEEIDTKFICLKEYKRTLSGEGREMMKIYREQGIEALISTDLDSLEALKDGVSDRITDYILNNYDSKLLLSGTKEDRLPKKRPRIELKKTKVSAKMTIKSSVSQSLASDKDALIQKLRAELKDKENQISNQAKTIEEFKLICNRYHPEIPNHTRKIELQAKKIEVLRLRLHDKLNKLDDLKGYTDQLQYDSKQITFILLKMRKELEELKTNENYSISLLAMLKNNAGPHHEKAQILSSIRSYETDIRQLNHQNKNNLNKLETDLNTDLSSSFSGKRYIYVPKSDTKCLLQYDITSENVNIIELNKLPRDFLDSNTCELPNGDVFCVSFNHLGNAEVYLYKLATKECIILPSLMDSRSFLSLFYYKNYVYAFGGKNSNRAQRYSLSNNKWETLPNMNYSRSCLSCVGIFHKIYLFYGSSKNIEIFNIRNMQFEQFEFDNSDSDGSICGVAFKVEDKVYLVTDNLTQVYDTTLTKIKQYTNAYSMKHYTIHNKIYYNNSIYYYNYNTLTIEKLDISFPIPETQIYLDDLNRYIYKARNNTKFIHRIDLETSTIQSIDLSKSLARNFDCASLCVLNTGYVIIAGLRNPVTNECYLFSPSTNTCTKIANLNTPRSDLTLIYHDRYVYAFGGRNGLSYSLRDAEKIHTSFEGSWIVMPDMIHSRNMPGCIAVGNKIYIMRGGYKPIEEFDIITNSYRLSPSVYFGDFVLSIRIDDEIHMIGENYYKILTKELETISDFKGKWKSEYITFTFGNIVHYKDSIYFFNDGRNILERVNPVSFEREFQIVTHSIAHW